MDKSDFDYLWGRRSDIQLRALTNRLYQQERQRIFELREGFIKAASIFASSVAFAKVTDVAVVQWCAALIAAGSICALVFGFGNKARDAAKRSTEWAQLERDIEAAGQRTFTEDQLAQWAAKANEIEAGEPAANRILLERCYLRACESLGATPEPKGLPWWIQYGWPILIP